MRYNSDITRGVIYDTLESWQGKPFPCHSSIDVLMGKLERLATHWTDDELAVWAYGYAQIGLVLYPSTATVRRLFKKLQPWSIFGCEAIAMQSSSKKM